jgi:hypothetical protein
MMTDTLTGFTTEELDTLRDGLNAYIDGYEGVCTPEEIQSALDLRVKVDRLLLVGKKVRFLHKGEELTGELQGYKDWEGILMADIARKGFIYRVGVKTELLGEV